MGTFSALQTEQRNRENHGPRRGPYKTQSADSRKGV
jgi:hypothetical protein